MFAYTYRISVGPLVAWALCTWLAASAPAGIIRHDANDAEYLALAQQPQFAPVGTLNFSPGSAFPLCTGTLIAPRWVLTAGHCVTNFSGPEDTTFTVGGRTYRIDEYVPHPLWNGQPEDWSDLGLVKLSRPVTSVTPAQRYRGSDEFGSTFVSVGFGETGDGLTGNVSGTHGAKRAGMNTWDHRGPFIFDFPDHVLWYDFDSPDDPSLSQWGDADPLGLEYMAVQGDSGSGVFIEEAGTWQLAAVQSFGIRLSGGGPPIMHYGDVGGSMTIAPFNDWIDSVIPEPGTGLLLLALLGAVRRERPINR